MANDRNSPSMPTRVQEPPLGSFTTSEFENTSISEVNIERRLRDSDAPYEFVLGRILYVMVLACPVISS